MIAERIRDRVERLCKLADAGPIPQDKFIILMQGFMRDADMVAMIEAAPVSDARAHAKDEGVVDFVAARNERQASSWAEANGFRVVDPTAPGEPA